MCVRVYVYVCDIVCVCVMCVCVCDMCVCVCVICVCVCDVCVCVCDCTAMSEAVSRVPTVCVWPGEECGVWWVLSLSTPHCPHTEGAKVSTEGAAEQQVLANFTNHLRMQIVLFANSMVNYLEAVNWRDTFTAKLENGVES